MHDYKEEIALREIMRAYNGTKGNVWAEKYGDVALEYYEVFMKYNSSNKCGLE